MKHSRSAGRLRREEVPAEHWDAMRANVGPQLRDLEGTPAKYLPQKIEQVVVSAYMQGLQDAVTAATNAGMMHVPPSEP